MWTCLAISMGIAHGVFSGGPDAQGQRYVLRPESRISIHGSSTVNRFTCESGRLIGTGRLGERPEVTLEVAGRSFDCGNRRMNQVYP